MAIFSDDHSLNVTDAVLEPLLNQYHVLPRGRGRGFAASWTGGVHLESLANLAHELRTPVQVLLGYLDILRDSHAPDSGDVFDREIIERMNSNVYELAQTVENVMDFALAEAEAGTDFEEAAELTEFFAEIDPILKAANHNPNLSVVLELEDAARTILVRRRPLRAIVVNLAINAIKFTLAGRVTIRVRKIPRENVFQIEISDTGTGMSRELLSHAFEPLVQLSHASGRHHRGMGLGLAVVQRNVKALGGKLQVESVIGAGSCFTVTIPISTALPGLPSHPAQAAM